MKLKAEWGAIRRHIEAALHPAKTPDAPDLARPVQDNREWVVVYRIASGFCCMYGGLPVDFEDILDVQMWADEMDVRTYFMGM